LFALCTLNFELLQAQYFTLGADPASVRWNQIRTENFRIIYPNTLDSQALYIANAYEYIHSPVAAYLGVKPRRWPVILHNRTVVSNAFAPYAPKRIEMITTPPQDNYAQSWIDQLILHEYRHAVQYTAVNRGLTRALSIIFGQQAVPAVIGLFMPFWFIEGDAVVMETALGRSGRGKVPSFEMKLRAQFLEKGIYAYDKAVNGSYKNFIPNHYELGYLLVGHTRVQYGPETWDRVIRKTGNIPLMLVPFSNTLYKETGFGKSRLYDKITGVLREDWKQQNSKLLLTDYQPLKELRRKFYTNYSRPVVLEDGTVIARRTSIDDITRIVTIASNGREKILLTPGSMTDEGLSGAGTMICWAEIDRDLRWEQRSFSVIKTYDLQSGKLTQLTRKTRYFSPALSADSHLIAAVEVNEDNFSHLVVLDAVTGDILHKFPAPENYFLSYPAWSPDGKHVAAILARHEGKSLVLFGLETPGLETLLPFTNTDISKPSFYRHYILFTGAYTGIENIFAFDLNTRKLYQVTSARFGAIDAKADHQNGMLYYSDYSSDGYQLVKCPLTPENWTITDPVTKHFYPLAEQLTAQENFIFQSEDVPDTMYNIKKYRKGLNLFNFHSWAPVGIEIDNTNINPGVTLMSQNLLSTSFVTLAYTYDLNEEAGKYSLKYTYEGLYPVIDLSADYGLRRGVHTDTAGNQNPYKYHELNAATIISIPLSRNVRSWFMGIRPSAGYSYKYLRMDPEEELRFRKDRFHSLDYRVFMYAQSRRSHRDMQPRWGQLLQLNYSFTPFEADTGSSIFAANGLLYFPGIFRHHGLRLYGGYQQRHVELYRYGNLINFPRGYTGIYADKAVSGNINYLFPIFYPEWRLGPVIYMKRLKGAVFYDHIVSFDQSPYQHYQSFGLDLTLDFHLFRFFVPLELGVRTVYRVNDRAVGFEFLYRLDLDSVY
ncbi:MAG: hypothetical protein K0B08_12560, partial [Bacteroidales bacterium]|nr:hypothetical protein [Bacteroidales bacterium]